MIQHQVNSELARLIDSYLDSREFALSWAGDQPGASGALIDEVARTRFHNIEANWDYHFLYDPRMAGSPRIIHFFSHRTETEYWVLFESTAQFRRMLTINSAYLVKENA